MKESEASSSFFLPELVFPEFDGKHLEVKEKCKEEIMKGFEKSDSYLCV